MSTPSACERQRFLVEQLGEGERHLDAVAVVLVGDGVDDGHRAGQGELDLVRGMGAGDQRLEVVDAALQPQRRHHLRHHRLVAVVADAHLDLVGEVDALDRLEKAVDEMLPRLLAVGDDVDAGILLQLQRQDAWRRAWRGRVRRRPISTAPTACSARRAIPASAASRRSWSETASGFSLGVSLRLSLPCSRRRAYMGVGTEVTSPAARARIAAKPATRREPA